MKTNFKSQVFSRAWQIVKNTGKSFAVSLSKAWQLYRLGKLMSKGNVKFTYEKVDGTLRQATGTLKDVSQFIKGGGNNDVNAKVFHYWDLGAVAFRCFKVENLVSIK